MSSGSTDVDLFDSAPEKRQRVPSAYNRFIKSVGQALTNINVYIVSCKFALI